MDLWVRSISKRILLKVDNILVVEADNKHCLYTLSHDEEIELGEYETKERALKVLDEIQRILVYGIIDTQSARANGSISLTNPNCIVFEMPEK